jgi:hypothetical protein
MSSNLLPAKEDFAVRVFLPALFPASVSDHVSSLGVGGMVEFHSQTTMAGYPETIVPKDNMDRGTGTRSTWDFGRGDPSQRKRAYCTKGQ